MEDPTKINIQTNITKDRDPTLVRMQGVTAHKHIEFDAPFMTPITSNLWQGGCQNGLILPYFIKHLVSLYPWEQYTIKHEMDSRLEIRMYDSLAEGFEQVEMIARWVNLCRQSGPVLVHCQAGLNRSSLIVVRALMLEGMSADEAINMVRTLRSPACLCNDAFEEHLRSL